MKKILAAVVVAALTMGTLSTADARIGSSSSSSSSSRSMSSSSFSSRSMSSSSSRLGGGGSLGVSRPTAMAAATAQSQSVRQYGNVSANTPTSRTTSTTTTVRQSNNYYGNRPSYYSGGQGYGHPGYTNGYSGGQMAMAAIGGAVAGAAIDHAMTNRGTTIINNGAAAGVPAYSNGGTVYSDAGVAPAVAVPVAPQAVYVEPRHSFWSVIWVILGISAVVAIIIAMIRAFGRSTVESIYSEPADYTTTTTRTTTTTVDPEEARDIGKAKNLLANAPQIFRSLQEANNRGDKARIEAMSTPLMYSELAAQINARDGATSNTVVKSIRVAGDQVLDLRLEGDELHGSIHFKGVVKEGESPDEEISEVWHFVSQGAHGSWKLEGIEQLPQ